MIKKVLLALILSVILSFSLAGTALANTATTWELNPDANAEVSIDENTDTITVGTWGAAEGAQQPVAVHGATIELPPAQQIYVEFDYELYSWDSYNAPGTPNPPWWGGTGYWDLFSISVSQDKYWNLGLSDPLNGDPLDIGFYWGATSFGDGFIEGSTGSGSATMAASLVSTNYLNVVLDTATLPSNNGSYPSYGEFVITKIEITGSPDIEKTLFGAWEAVSDDGILDLGEKWYFGMVIDVMNWTPMAITDIMVKDNFAGDLEVVLVNGVSVVKPPGKKDNTWNGTGLATGVTIWWTGNTAKAHMTWDVGDIASMSWESLVIVVATDMNTGNGNGNNQKFPNGHQEYTSEGEHCLNSGATATGLVTLGSGVWEVSNTSDEICVEVGVSPIPNG